MNELERAKYFTMYYDALKGLRLVPSGLFMILIAMRDSFDWTLLGTTGDLTYTLPLLLLMFVLYFAANYYYIRRYGSVQPRNQETQWVIGCGMLLLFIVVIMLDMRAGLPLSLISAFIGAGLLFSGWKSHRAHYLIGGAVMAVLTLLPIIPGMDDPTRFMPFSPLFSFTLGLVFVVLGVVDHFILVRELRPVREGDYARAE